MNAYNEVGSRIAQLLDPMTLRELSEVAKDVGEWEHETFGPAQLRPATAVVTLAALNAAKRYQPNARFMLLDAELALVVSTQLWKSFLIAGTRGEGSNDRVFHFAVERGFESPAAETRRLLGGATFDRVGILLDHSGYRLTLSAWLGDSIAGLSRQTQRDIETWSGIMTWSLSLFACLAAINATDENQAIATALGVSSLEMSRQVARLEKKWMAKFLRKMEREAAERAKILDAETDAANKAVDNDEGRSGPKQE